MRSITENGVRRVVQDLHVTGLFSLKAWTSLLEEAGFNVDRMPLPARTGTGNGCLRGCWRDEANPVSTSRPFL